MAVSLIFDQIAFRHESITRREIVLSKEAPHPRFAHDDKNGEFFGALGKSPNTPYYFAPTVSFGNLTMTRMGSFLVRWRKTCQRHPTVLEMVIDGGEGLRNLHILTDWRGSGFLL